MTQWPPVNTAYLTAPSYLIAAPIPVMPAPNQGGRIATILLRGALAVGANMVAVKQGTMSPGMAVLNGLAKSAVSSLTLAHTDPLSPVSVIKSFGILVASGYVIDQVFAGHPGSKTVGAG